MQDLARLGIADDGAYWHFERDVLTRSPEHVRAHAMLAFFGFVTSGKTKVDQGVQGHIGHRIDIATAPAIAPVGTAELFVLFVPKRHATISPVASAHVYQSFINEFHGGLFIRINKRNISVRNDSAIDASFGI